MESLVHALSVAAVFGLLAAVLWWLRRKGLAQFGGVRAHLGRGARWLEVVESKTLGAGHAVHLLRVADRAMVVAVHGSGCTLLDTRAWSDLSAHPETRA